MPILLETGEQTNMNTDCFFKRTIQRPQTGEDYTLLCFDYFDGKRSAMLRYSRGEEVRVKDLEREISRTIADGDLVRDKDIPKMFAFQRFVSRHGAMCDAAVMLMDAAIAFDSAVRAIEMEPYYAARLQERCMDTRLPSERAGEEFVEVQE